jgi:hypothetical protein
VTTVTDTVALPGDNHLQIVGAKRVPASRGGANASARTSFDVLFENQKEEKADLPHSRSETQIAAISNNSLFQNTLM